MRMRHPGPNIHECSDQLSFKDISELNDLVRLVRQQLWPIFTETLHSIQKLYFTLTLLKPSGRRVAVLASSTHIQLSFSSISAFLQAENHKRNIRAQMNKYKDKDMLRKHDSVPETPQVWAFSVQM